MAQELHAASRLVADTTIEPEDGTSKAVEPLEPDDAREVDNGGEACKLEAGTRLVATK
jgi:hypothetical protein